MGRLKNLFRFKKDTKQMRVTVYFGYALFLLLAITTVLSLLPWVRNFAIPTARHWNIVMLLIGITAAAIVPPLIGYFVGDRSTRKKSKLLHHHNGVLFAVLAIWVAMVFDYISYYLSWAFSYSPNVPFIVSYLPVMLATIVFLVALGVFYAKHTRHQVSLIDYKPYRWSFIGFVLAQTILLPALSPFFGADYNANIWMSILLAFIGQSLIILIAGLAGYWIVGKRSGTGGERVVKSLTALSFGTISVTIVTHIVSIIGAWQDYYVYYGYIVAVVVLIAYLLLLRRASN